MRQSRNVTRVVARVVAAGVGVGLVGGGVAALAIPDAREAAVTSAPTMRASTGRITPTPPPPSRARSSVAASAAASGSAGSRPAAAVRRVAAARPDPTSPGAVRLRVRGPLRVVARRPDPAGGPDWAVRVFRADRTFRDHGRLRTIGRNRCVQLGRIHRGRFGWLDGAGTFRPVRPSLFGSPTDCGSRRADMGGRPHLEVLETLTGTGGVSPHLTSTVAWGRLGAAARDVRFSVGGRLAATSAGPQGVLLDVRAPDGSPPRAAVSASYPGRGVVDARAGGGRAAVLAARAADPRGGPTYGLSVSREAGRWCTGAVGRVVDGRVGVLDFRFGTFRDVDPRGCTGRPGRDPVLLDEMSGGEDLGNDPMYTEGAPRAQGTARRSAPGLTWVAGRVSDDVRSITFRTPHDVRTLAPSAVGHAFLVVYDGQFPSGRSEMVLRLAGGRSVRRPLFLGVY